LASFDTDRPISSLGDGEIERLILYKRFLLIA